jgi:hypothetical protein
MFWACAERMFKPKVNDLLIFSQLEQASDRSTTTMV